jgi:N6-L-threonylcarbamoyladenine synthase
VKILGIETSCDETSAAVVEDGTRILSNIIASQIDIHSKFGGVVPEVASRAHVELILPTIQEALDQAQCTMSDIDCVAVINRPGLIGALIVGVAAAKTIAYGAGLPLVGVHHLEAHIYANFLADPTIDFPLICLVVSGGHSDLVYMAGHGDYEILARTRDDAAGECFDKCARAMGLGYPGGPFIDDLARNGNPTAVDFPRAKVGDTLDFSFSGLKTAVIRRFRSASESVPLADIAASFQQAVVDVLVDHTFRAAEQKGVKLVLTAGGVAANSALQSAMRSTGERLGISVGSPPPMLCTDNAAMAAAAAYFNYQRGEISDLDLDCFASDPPARNYGNSAS